MTLDEIKCPVVHATLEVLVMHLGRVAEAANRMDIDNLGLLFGQVIMREGEGGRQKNPPRPTPLAEYHFVKKAF